MEQATPKNTRPGLRLVCALISLLFFAYLVEISIMGAPDFRKHSQRIYYREKDPVPFWSQFTVFALVGIAAGYCCINWSKALPLIESSEERERQRLLALGKKEAQRERRNRDLAIAIYSLTGLAIVALLIALLIEL